jgi:hypothetical protein
MIDRVTELQARVQTARAALEGLVERAARLRARLEGARIAARDSSATVLVPPSVMGVAEPTVPPEETTKLASSLERLTQTSWVAVSSSGGPEGDDGRFVSDAWEIALISEEGK